MTRSRYVIIMLPFLVSGDDRKEHYRKRTQMPYDIKNKMKTSRRQNQKSQNNTSDEF